jgi:hypothetical protein
MASDPQPVEHLKQNSCDLFEMCTQDVRCQMRRKLALFERAYEILGGIGQSDEPVARHRRACRHRKVGRMPGLVLITSAVIMVKPLVRTRPCSTLSMEFVRVSRYAFGANFMNH